MKRIGLAALAALFLSAPAIAQAPPQFPIPALGSATATQTLATGTAGTAITITTNGAGTLSITLTGLTASAATVAFSASDNGGTSFYSVNAISGAANARATTATADASYSISVAGRTTVQITVATAGTGTVTASYTSTPFARDVTVESSAAAPLFAQITALPALPAGSNTIGFVQLAPGSGSVKIISVTTAAAVGTSSVGAVAGAYGFYLHNTGTTPCFWSDSVASGTVLSASNSDTLAAGGSFTTPDWWPYSGNPVTVASTSTTACVMAGYYR